MSEYRRLSTTEMGRLRQLATSVHALGTVFITQDNLLGLIEEIDLLSDRVNELEQGE